MVLFHENDRSDQVHTDIDQWLEDMEGFLDREQQKFGNSFLLKKKHTELKERVDKIRGQLRKIDLRKQISLEKDHLKFMHQHLQEGEKVVFIGVYQSEGKKIRNWEALMASLPEVVVGRSVYTHESEARSWLERTEMNFNEGYVVAKVHEKKLRNFGKVDGLGQSVFAIENKDITQGDVFRFVHAGGHVYQWVEQKLLVLPFESRSGSEEIAG